MGPEPSLLRLPAAECGLSVPLTLTGMIYDPTVLQEIARAQSGLRATADLSARVKPHFLTLILFLPLLTLPLLVVVRCALDSILTNVSVPTLTPYPTQRMFLLAHQSTLK